jgi:hypothetical protein
VSIGDRVRAPHGLVPIGTVTALRQIRMTAATCHWHLWEATVTGPDGVSAPMFTGILTLALEFTAGSATLQDLAPMPAESTDAAPIPCDAPSPIPANAAGPGAASEGPDESDARCSIAVPARPPADSVGTAIEPARRSIQPISIGAIYRHAQTIAYAYRPRSGHPCGGIFGAAPPVMGFLGPIRSGVRQGQVSRCRAGSWSTGPPGFLRDFDRNFTATLRGTHETRIHR